MMIIPFFLLFGFPLLISSSIEENVRCDNKYDNGERFNSGNFIKECTSIGLSWSIEFVACLTPLKKEIELGSSIVEDGVEYECIETDSGASMETNSIRNKRENKENESNEDGTTSSSLLTTVINQGCHHGKYKKGTNFTVPGKNSCRYTCKEDNGEVKAIGCLTANNKVVLIGEQFVRNGKKFRCSVQNGKIRFGRIREKKPKGNNSEPN